MNYESYESYMNLIEQAICYGTNKLNSTCFKRVEFIQLVSNKLNLFNLFLEQVEKFNLF